MKLIFTIVIFSITFISCGSYTPTEPDSSPIEGYWSGETEQGKEISFYVTSQTLGEIELKFELPDYSTGSFTILSYEEFGDDGYWSRDVEGESFTGDVHTLFIQGQFLSADSCTGDFTAESETWIGGYSVQAEFTVSPD